MMDPLMTENGKPRTVESFTAALEWHRKFEPDENVTLSPMERDELLALFRSIEHSKSDSPQPCGLGWKNPAPDASVSMVRSRSSTMTIGGSECHDSGTSEQLLATMRPFYEKHALGPLAAPSCFMCGDSVPEHPAVQHGELPGIVACRRCHEACQDAKQQSKPGAVCTDPECCYHGQRKASSCACSSACTSEPFVCCGATGFRPCPTFEASCKNPANYGFPFARRVNAVLATRGLCLDASQLAALIQDPPTPHRAGAETYDEHRQNAIDDASRYEEVMAHALTNAFGLLRRVRDRVDAVQFFEADAAMKLLEEVMAARRMPHEECCGQGCAECQPPHPKNSLSE